MSLFRIASLTSLCALAGLVACATTTPLDEDGGFGPDRADATKGLADAEPGAPDAMRRPDAAIPDAAVPLPPDASIPHTPDAAVPHPDAAVPHPDAAVPHPDAAVPHPDAAVPHPDAAPTCTPTTMNLLANGNFDSGPNTSIWTESGPAGEIILKGAALMGHAAQSGTYAAWLNGFDNGTDILTQTVAVPAGATGLRLKGQRWIETLDDTSAVYDTLDFQILGATGTTVKESIGSTPPATHAFSNMDTTTAWTAFDLPITGSYAGQTIRLRLKGTTDALTGTATSFFLDTLQLQATVCQ